MGQVRGKSLPELLQLLRQARRQRARREQCQGSHCRPAMVETCESTSAGMGWAEVEAPLAYRAAAVVGMEANPAGRAVLPARSAATLVMMVEMEVPTSLLDQFLNL